jgi:hypothetical protein
LCFPDAPAELRKDHHRHIVGAPMRSMSRIKPYTASGSIGEQAFMQIRLLHVGVERIVAIGNVVQTRRHAGVDQRGYLGEIQRNDAVVDGRFVFAPRLTDQG